MNERMKLKIERELFPQSIRKITLNDGTDVERYFDKYKFAELIIQECISALDEADGSVHHSKCLIEHFGVYEE